MLALVSSKLFKWAKQKLPSRPTLASRMLFDSSPVRTLQWGETKANLDKKTQRGEIS